MLTIAEMRKIKPYEHTRTDRENVFYITSADGLASHLIKSLLYRLENIEKKSYIVIQDTEKVNSRDIANGLYIESDEGKSRAEVLSARYGGVFSTEVIAGGYFADSEMFYINGEEQYNLFVVNTNGKNDYRGGAFSRLVVETSRGSTVFLIEAFYNGDEFVLRAKIGEDGVLIGSTDQTIVRNTGYSLPEQYIRNAVTAQLIFNLINTIVTEGMKFNYTTLRGHTKIGAITREYNKNRGKESLFVRLKVTGDVATTKEALDFDVQFADYESEHIERVRNKSRLMVQSGLTSVIGYINLVGINLGMYLNDVEDAELAVVRDILTKAVPRGRNYSEDEFAVLNLLVSYVESRIGSVWGV